MAGSLPQGLSLDPASGAITGTPNGLSGTFQVIIEVTNRYGTARSGALIEIGEVVDFLHFDLWGGYSWPDFNFADTWIVIGVGLLVLELLASEGEERAGLESGESRS